MDAENTAVASAASTAPLLAGASSDCPIVRRGVSTRGLG